MNFTVRHTETHLNPPIPVGKVALIKREHLIIDAFSSSGITSTAEASPLPTLNTETIDEAFQQLSEISSLTSLYDLPSSDELLKEGIEALWKLPALYPSVAFGLESAILGIIAKIENVSLSHLLNPHAVSKITTNSLISPHISPNPIADLKSAQAKGITCFKIKIGHQDTIFDIELIQDLAMHLNDNDTLRLDSNGSWDIETWAAAAKEWEGIPIEYIEDPMPNPDDLHHFHDMTRLNIAADQWTLTHPLEDLLYIPGLTAIIIKPTAFGAISKIHRYKQQLKGTHLNLVISNCFEAKEGRDILIELAKAYSGATPVGIQGHD